MVPRVVGVVVLLATLARLGGCTRREPSPPAKDTLLTERIERLVDTFLMESDDAKEAAALSDARAIFAREGVPTVAKVGDVAAYGFVLVNVFGQPADVREQFIAKVRDAAARHELPADAVLLAEARLRQAATEERYRTQVPSQPGLRDQISRLLRDDQAVRDQKGFDVKKMEAVDRRTAGPLKAIFDTYGVPTYDMVGVEAAKGFIVMVQHQGPEFRTAVLPKLKANVDAGQADPQNYAMVYDGTRRDNKQNQLYGEALECTPGKGLEEAPMDDEANVNRRRAELGMMRVELYARLVRLMSPDVCASGPAPE